MRICHVSPHLPPDQAANALLPAHLGQWMNARGDDVAFVAHVPAHAVSGGASHLLPDAPVRWITRRRHEGSVRRVFRLDAWGVVRQVSAALDAVARRADLLHLHSNGLIIEAAAAWARRRGIPYVLTLYGTEIWHYRARRPIDPFTRAYKRAGRVTFYSQRLLEHALTVGLDRPGLSVIYPPVADMFRPQDERVRQEWRARLDIRERFVVVNVKRLHPLAGQRFLLEAFARLTADRDDVRLVICGDGPLREALTNQASALGIANRVTLTGLLPNETIATYMAIADAFALPSLLEALPTVAVEALASGTPVVSADHPGGLELQALFGDDVTVVPRESVEPLARAVSERLRHPQRASTETARQISQTFRPVAVMRAFDDVYRQVAGGRR